MMKKATKVFSVVLDSLIVFFLSTMVILVFSNVLLRYVLNGGITWSEELARFSFVWLVFLGAIKAFKDGAHIIVDLMVAKLPRVMQILSFLMANLLIIIVMFLFLDGVMKMMELNANVNTPAANLPQNSLYIVGAIAALAIILMSFYKTISVLFFDAEKPPWMKEKKPRSEGGELK